jgi:mono/diheme cytochrome c family protein
MAFAQTTSIQLPRDNPVSQLKAGSGEDVVRKHCAACHSTDYIVRQPHLDTQHWSAEVNKMMTVFGARISEADAKIIIEYLGKNYGEEVGTKESPSSK